MQQVELADGHLSVSRIAMGCWALAGDATWGPQDESDALAAVHAALDVGINLFDTAEMYGDGSSERLLGKALAGRRDRAIIASKFNPEHSAPEAVVAACERSLKYLSTDYLDLYQIHWASRTVSLADTWAAMQKLKQQGKVRTLGVCNFGTGDLSDLLAIGRPASNQLPYNLLMRAIEHEILPLCRQNEIGVLCYSPLLVSMLSGKYSSADEMPAGRARLRHFSSARPQTRHGEPGCEAETFAAIAAIRQISRDIGRTMSEVAIAWLLHQPGVASVISGLRDRQQVCNNAAAADLTLAPDVLALLDEVTAPVKRAIGRNPDMWQTASQSRFR